MSTPWDRIAATGSGQIAWRVSIEGYPADLVSHTNMMAAAAPDGRERIHGLKSDGFVFGQKVDLVTGAAEGSSFRVKLANPKDGARIFGKRPPSVTYLSSDETSSATTIRCPGAQAFPTSGRAYVNTETFQYTATATNGFLGCVRGEWESLAQYHYTTDGERQRYPDITDHPVVLEGRRVRFYAYAPGDDKQGDGTLVWVGVASTDANFSGIVWSFQVDSLFRVFDQDVGGDLSDPSPIRGIYYPETGPLVLRFYETDGIDDETAGVVTTRGAIAIAGFWETQRDFLEDLNTAIAAELTAQSFNQTDFRAVEDGESWAIEFVTDAATPRYMSCEALSPTDRLGVLIDPGSSRGIGRVSASSVYRIRQREDLPGLGTVPRACIGGFLSSRTEASSLDEAQKTGMDGTHVAWRIYVGGGAAVTANTTTLSLDWQSADLPMLATAFSGTINCIVTAVDGTSRYIDFARPADLRPLPGSDDRDPLTGVYAVCLGTGPATIRMGRDYGFGSLSDFLGISGTTGLMDQTQQWVNTGAVPNIHPLSGGVIGDFSMASSDNEIQLAAASNRFTSQRQYSVFAEVTLRDMIEHECRLLGIYPVIESGQYITFKRLRLPAPSEVSTDAVTAQVVLTDDRIISWERAALGVYNTVRIRTGYDPIRDEHTGPVYKIRDVAAFGQSPNSRVLDIEPKSGDPSSDITFQDVVEIGAKTLGVFGGPYVYVSFDVPMKLWGTEPGDVISITWSKIPNSDGTLGVTDKLGLVTHAEFEPMKGRGMLTVLLTDQRIAGYAPASVLSGIAGTTGTTGPFTANAAAADFPSGTNAATFFEAGDLIRLYRIDSTSTPSITLGTVSSVTTNSVTFTTATNWTYSTHEWALGLRVSTAITADKQKLYAFVGRSDGLVDFDSDTDNPPTTFAP